MQLFREEILADLRPVEEILALIRAKFETKVHERDRNPDGVLTCAL